MYSENRNYMTYFVEKEEEGASAKFTPTDKVFYGKLSESIKVGEENGKNKYEFETWNARFVSAAREKVEKLADKTSIVLTKWAVRNPYNKQKKRSYPYIMVMDFEVASEVAENKASE